MTAHGVLACATLLVLIVAFATRFVRRFGRIDRVRRWTLVVAAIALPPILTTGMLAHCLRVWRWAKVESIPPNLPWYRAVRDAAINRPESAAMSRHAWIGGVTAGLVAVTTFGRARIRSKRRGAALAILGVFVCAAIASGFGLARHDGIPPTPSPALPPWGAGEWDDPAATDHSLVVPLHVCALLAGLSLSAGLAVMGPAPRPQTPRKSMILVGTCAIATFILTAAAHLWLTTGFQPSRLPAVFRQPRDAALLMSIVLALVSVALLLRASPRRRKRVTIGAVVTLGIALAAILWFNTLVLYDGSDRASDLWRFQRPYDQRASP